MLLKCLKALVKSLLFCSFVSLFIVLATLFNEIFESSKASTVFIISFTSSFENIKVVVSEPNIFLLYSSISSGYCNS